MESTIKRDPTAPHYKFIDDPYLIPASNNDKRSFALSREAGRKAAMWIRQEHAEFFDHKIAEPFIEVIYFLINNTIYYSIINAIYYLINNSIHYLINNK